ncbi:MAG: hypothetical protein NT015_17210 [Alphaproteobacteria bacterium]|nr:hypothetical protein [Alphaproteobacteria bacterium]
MTWFGAVSAWAAAVAGVALALLASLQFSAGVVPWLTMLSAALLMTGAFRTLRKMSGGLRLLCGAWGFVAAFLFGAAHTMVLAVAIPENAPAEVVAGVLNALPLIALAGLTLTVTHKETK